MTVRRNGPLVAHWSPHTRDMLRWRRLASANREVSRADLSRYCVPVCIDGGGTGEDLRWRRLLRRAEPPNPQ